MSTAGQPPRALVAEILRAACAPDPAGASGPPGAWDPTAALMAAGAWARERGFVVLPLGLQPASDARELASLHAAIALQSVRFGRPLAPTVLLSAGPVRREGAAAGAADFLLALALALDDNRAMYAAVGAPGAAPYLLGPDTVARAAGRGLSAGAHWEANTAHDFFVALGEIAETLPQAATVAQGDGVLRALLITQE